jgi:hypothetical protein
MLPVATVLNVIAYSTGNVRIQDMARERVVSGAQFGSAAGYCGNERIVADLDVLNIIYSLSGCGTRVT